MEKKVTIEKNGMKITLEGYSMQEINDILTEEPKQVREVNLNDLIKKQRPLVDTDELTKPMRVVDPIKPFFDVICII